MNCGHEGSETGGERTREGGLRRPNGLLVRMVGDELVILDPILDQVHQLNATASLIWTLADQGLQPSKIACIMAERFDINEETAYQDADGIVKELIRLRLLTDTSRHRASAPD